MAQDSIPPGFVKFTGELDPPAESNVPPGFVPFTGKLDAPAGGTASDLAKSLKVGTQRLPGMVTGLADLPFAMAAGARPFTKAADALGEVTGFQPGKWADETKFSAGYEQGKKAVDDAWKDGSAGDIALAYLKNPGYTANQVVESAPGMVAGGLAGRALMGVGRVAAPAARAGGVGPAVPGLAERALGQWAAPVAAGVGEGAVKAGQQMAQYQGEDQQTNALASLGAGAVTGLVGVGAGRVANKLGLETAETAIAKAGTGAAKAADDVPLSAKRRILGGMVSEALLQELPQSAQEQMWQNWADGKPLMEGVARAATEGAIAGGVMGAGANVSDGGAGKRRALAEQQAKQLAEAEAEALRADPSRAWTTEAGAVDPNQPAGERAAPPEAPDLTTSPGAGVARDGMDFTRDVDTSGLSLQDPAELERQRAATVDYQTGDTTPQWDTQPGAAPVRSGLDMPAPDFDTGALGFDPRPLSERMGLVPAANTPLTKAAALSVDTGASPVQFLGATGRDMQLRQTGPGVADESNVIDVQGRVVEDRAIGTPRRFTAQESARESGAIAFQDGVPRSEIAAIPNIVARAEQLRGYDEAAQNASSVPALPAPTNLREGLERIRAQQQEAANAQAATPQAAPAATTVSTARPAAGEAAGPATIPATTGATSVPQASQTQQGSTQSTQAGGPQVGAATAQASTSPAGGNRVQAAWLTNGAPTQNPGAQAATAAGAQGQAPQTAVARPDGWRKSMLRAAPIARAMGIDPKGKRLAQVVAEIDARDTRTPAPPAPQPAPGPVRLGRNNTPLNEGGKPFKTRKAAGDAKKLQPMMRVVTVEGGYALAEKTPAQLAAEERASRRLRSPSTSAPGEPIPAHAFIAAAGGLNRAAAADMGVDGNQRIGNRTLFAGQGRGLSIEQATQMLIQDGYLSEGALHNDAYALIKTSLTRPQYNADGYERIAEAEAQTQFEDYLAAHEEAAAEGDADPFGMADSFTAEELDEVGYTDADPALQAEVAALTAQADAMGIDTYAILDDIARTYADATQDEFNAKARDALAAAIARGNQDGGSTAAQAAPAAEPAADQELDQPPALELASQAPAELPTDSASERFSVGRSLTKAQRQQVLASLVDAYKAKGAQREFKGLDGNGNERYGYIYSPDLFEKSDITGTMVRYYVTLPDGRIAHPSELFPYVSASDVERMALEQDAKRRRSAAYDNALKPFYSDFDSADLFAVKGQVVVVKDGRFAVIPERTGAIGRARENGWELASPSEQVSDQSAGTRAVREQQDGLTSYTAEEATRRQEEAELAAKAEAARQRAEDQAASQDENRKRIAQASVRAAAEFELGQDPLDSLTGQGGLMFSRTAGESGPEGVERGIAAAIEKAVQQWQVSLRNAASNPEAKEPGMATPAVLRIMGAAASRLVLPRTYLRAIMDKHGDVPAGVFENLPALLADPLFIIPHKDGGLRVFVEAQTAKGEPIAVGVSVGADGRIHTVTPLHDHDGMTGQGRMARAVVTATSRIYAKNKEALAKAKASAEASPGTIPLQRNSNGNGSVITRADVVKRIAQGTKPGDPRFSFAGARAATADTHALVTAQDRLDAGEDPETVRQETGWHRGPDGRMRFEISDNEAKVDMALLANLHRGGFAERGIEHVSYRQEPDGTYSLTLAPKSPQKTSDFVSMRGIPENLLPSLLPQSALDAIEQNHGEEDLIGPNFDDARRVRVPFQFRGFNALPLDLVMDHPKLFAAYPALREIMVQVDPKLGSGASFAVTDYVDGTVRNVISIGNPLAKDVDSALLHEIQHGIQNIEGFATGDSPERLAKTMPDVQAINDAKLLARFMERGESAFDARQRFTRYMGRDPNPQGVYLAERNEPNEIARMASTPLDAYKRNAGEVEARNTQARQKLTADQRRATSPGSTADVADADVIVVFNGKEMANAPMPANAVPDADATVQPLRTPASTIRAAITKAYGKLLGQLESKGLVTLTQTEDEAIEAAAQARAAKTGQSVEQARAALRASVKNSVADQTQTENFQRWFKDSKAVDAEGKPLVVYHGTTSEFNTFRVGNAPGWGRGIYFTNNESVARDEYAGDDGRVVAAYVSLQNPYTGQHITEAQMEATEAGKKVLADGGNVIDASNDDGRFFGSMLRELGYDGVMLKGSNNIDGYEIVAFRPEQIKSATGNNGNFDPTDPDIRRSADGAIQGFFDPQTGQSFLIADNLTAEAAPGVLMHEVGIHMAADGSMKALFNRAAMMLKLQRGSPFMKAVQARMDAAGETSGEEAAAYIAEAYENDRANAPASVQRWLADLLAAVKAWMFKKGIMGADRLTVADIAAVARANARSMARDGGATGGQGFGPAFSRAPAGDQTQTEAFKRWFAGSKAVDADGKPLVVYHGSRFGGFSVFMRSAGGFIYTTPNADYASRFSGSSDGSAVYPAYVSIKKPLDLTHLGERSMSAEEARVELKRLGVNLDEVRPWEGAPAEPVKLYGDGPIWRLIREDRFSIAAKNAGFDGIKINEGDGEVAWVAFEPTQVKSAIGNNGNFDPANPDIRFSRAVSPSRPAAWDAPTPTGFDDVIYKLQDKNIDLKRVVESISKATGQVSDSINAYLKEELFHKRAAKRVADFGDRELKPLMNKMRLAGLSMEDVEEYLHARHAKEANAVIAQRNPGNAGLQDGGSGMTNAAADNYFAKLDPAQRRKLEAVAKSVDAIIEGTRKLYVSYGLEDQAVVDGWANMYQHYIPLMREDKDGGMGTGQGFSVKGKETKGRTGSTRKVVDILANVAMQREKLIVRGEKNIVAQALVGLAQANPNPDFWEVRSQAPTERVFDPKTGVVVDRPDPLFKSRDNVAVAKVKDANGKVTEQMVVFNEDNPRAVRMAAAMKNLDAGNLEGLLGVSAKITRYFAAINTQYNPVFGVVNLVRDVQGAMVNLGTTPLAGQQGKIAKDTLSALRGIYGDIRKTRKGGQATSQWSQLWEQMQDDGGTTGYRDLFKTSADRANDLKSILNPEGWMDSKWGKFFTADGRLKVPLSMAQKGATEIFGWLSDYNEAMENGVRLAAYKAALDKGMSREQAASLAKNLTVNFNRKGQAGMQAGAVYAFFNAAMQGTARIGQTLFDMDGGDLSTLRLSKTGKAVVYGGVMLGVMQALALSAAGFDDDDPPEFVRERSLIIPTGDKTYVSIPMPLGLHVIPGIGRHATEFALSGFDKPAKRAVSMVGMFADAFNPIGNAGLSMQTIAPTALDPLVALSENKDWTGKPIARVSSNKAMPGHTQWKDTATGFSKVVAEAINWISGGNEYVAGVFSPTPDQIDYLLAQVGGGVAREAAKVQQTISTAMSGETLPTHKIPLVGRFVGNAASQASQGSAFYANLNKLNELETEIKGLRKDGRFDEAAKLARENPQSMMIAMANRAERDVQRLRREKRELIANDASREQVRAKEDQITDVMTRLNEAVERRKAQAAR